MMKTLLLLLALMFLAVHSEVRIEEEAPGNVDQNSLVMDDDDNYGGGDDDDNDDDDDDDDNGSGPMPPSRECQQKYKQCKKNANSWKDEQRCRQEYRECVTRPSQYSCNRQRYTCLRNAGWDYYKRYLCEVRYRKCLGGSQKLQ